MTGTAGGFIQPLSRPGWPGAAACAPASPVSQCWQALRGGGFGSALVRDAVAEASAAGARLVGQTSTGQRADTHRIDEGPGVRRSHDAVPLPLR